MNNYLDFDLVLKCTSQGNNDIAVKIGASDCELSFFSGQNLIGKWKGTGKHPLDRWPYANDRPTFVSVGFLVHEKSLVD